MRLAIVIGSRFLDLIGGVYNRQDMGLAKALARQGYQIVIVRSGDHDEVIMHDFGPSAKVEERVVLTPRIRMHGLIGGRALNGIGIDGIISFQDSQLSVPSFFRWAVKEKVGFWPYVGSFSPTTNAFSRMVLSSNVKVYRKSYCIAKTPTMQEELRKVGVDNVGVLPVGLDLDLLAPKQEADREAARLELGIPEDAQVVGFVGRLEHYKRPLTALEVFAELRKRLPDVRFLVVGSGALEPEFEAKCEALGLNDRLCRIPKLLQKDMWKFYSACDILANFNLSEIYGMSLLESFYYGVPVVANRGPGPDFVIEHGVDGYLIDGLDEQFVEILEQYLTGKLPLAVPKDKVESNFTWDACLQRSGFPWPALNVA